MNTHYTLLGIAPEANQKDIETAYQQQRERYAVERVADMDDDIQATARERMAALEEAYLVLSDPEQRRAYDASIGLSGTTEQVTTSNPSSRPGLSARERWYALGGVAVAVLLVALVWTLTSNRTELPSVGEVNRPAPEVTLATLNGEDVQLSDYEGQVVLVNFWGTWCEPCKRETPALQTAYEELNDQGLVIIGVNLTNDEITLGNSEDDIHAFAEQYNVTYPIALDRMGEARKAFSVYPLPTSFFIDPYGNIRYVRVGEITTQEVTELFTALQQEATARSE